MRFFNYIFFIIKIIYTVNQLVEFYFVFVQYYVLHITIQNT